MFRFFDGHPMWMALRLAMRLHVLEETPQQSLLCVGLHYHLHTFLSRWPAHGTFGENLTLVLGKFDELDAHFIWRHRPQCHSPMDYPKFRARAVLPDFLLAIGAEFFSFMMVHGQRLKLRFFSFVLPLLPACWS